VSVDCSLVQNLLPEYAAGALDGRDRAAIENHLQSCADCRAEADTYVEVADSVLALAPMAEPPIGFEASVLSRLDTTPQRRVRRTALRVLAVAAAVLAVGLGIGRLSAPDHSSSLQKVALRADGHYVGKAWVHAGDPGWIYVDMRYRDTDHVINVEVVDDAGKVLPVGQLVLKGGHGTLGARSPEPVDSVHVIRMRESDGTIVCQARLS
jgi:putative zinc finger protein